MTLPILMSDLHVSSGTLLLILVVLAIIALVCIIFGWRPWIR